MSLQGELQVDLLRFACGVEDKGFPRFGRCFLLYRSEVLLDREKYTLIMLGYGVKMRIAGFGRFVAVRLRQIAVSR